MARSRPKRRSRRGFAGTPSSHLELAQTNLRAATQQYLAADEALRGGDCRAAVAEGARAVSASRAAVEHAYNSGSSAVGAAARAANAEVSDLMFKSIIPKCVK